MHGRGSYYVLYDMGGYQYGVYGHRIKIVNNVEMANPELGRRRGAWEVGLTSE